MKKLGLMGAVAGLAFAAGAAGAAPVTYSGITFPGGVSSFADAVVNFTPGTNLATSGACTDFADILGAPNYGGGTCDGYMSLGNGGSVTLQFTDNALAASGTSDADLHIFEIGAAVESMMVDISTNNSDWISLGTVSGQPTSIDIDAFAGVTFGTTYSYVRITDVFNNAFSGVAVYAGADVDAVGAIYSVPPSNNTVVPLPASALLMGGALAGFGVLRRRKG